MNLGRRNLEPRWVIAMAFAALCAAFGLSSQAYAQATTGNIGGVVTNAQNQPVAGASVIAIHEPSGTSYEATTRADGRYSIPNMRVGGPYTIQVLYVGTGNAAFAPQTKEGITVNLGASTDVDVVVQAITVAEEVTVSGQADPVFASGRTGAATQVSRDEIQNLPTISGRIGDITRMTPQASGTSFAGQDNRLNNFTVDGSYFNNSFGLGSEGSPGGRTGVAPISLESIEQVQVSVAPFDVRQGNFIGAAVNTVTRSGTNQFSGSVYHRTRSESYVGTEIKGLAVNPGTFTFRDTGVWAGVPIIKNKLFAFGNYENEEDNRPLHTFTANKGGEPVGGSVTRVLASDLTTLSAYLKQNFKYDTGGFENLPAVTPAKRYLIKSDYNLNNSSKISFRYNQLDSSTGKNLSSSTSVGIGRGTLSTAYLNFAASNYTQLENIKSGIGEWNSVLGNSISNSLIAGYTTNNENRAPIQLFPFVDILAPDGTAYLSFGSEPFTPYNELLHHTLQIKDDITKFGEKHSLTFGGTAQHYVSQNIFFPLSQSARTYSSLQDFYTDANDFLANPNRTTSPITLRRFQVRYNNIPGQEMPIQPLKVWYGGGYAQDEWRPRKDLTVTFGVRLDVPSFAGTALPNPSADALTFRNDDGSSVKYSTAHMPERKALWSPRAAFNWDVTGQQRTQLRAGTGVFTGPPLYVWISNQIGNTGVLTGFDQPPDNITTRPFSPDINRYKPTNITGAGAPSFELDVTDPDFKFPQVWRTNLAVDHKLPGGITSTTEFLYNKDINGIYYINANLPAPQTAFSGVDNRPRWTSNRLNATAPNVITSAIVMKNESVGKSWTFSEMLSKTMFHGLTMKGAYSYGEAQNTIDPGSTAFASWAGNEAAADPNNPGLGFSNGFQSHRVFVQTSYTRSYFSFGATTLSSFWEMRPSTPNFSTTASYVYAGDLNGDGASGNDLLYIPKDTSEMNFVDIAATSTVRAFSVAEQVAAFEAYINQDEYLSKHRGEYAKRGAVVYPLVKRIDLSIIQDVFRNIGGKRNSGQFRIDFTNFGNLLNHNWGASQRFVVPVTAANGAQILSSAGADAQGRASYRMAVASGALVTKTFQTSTAVSGSPGSDVYQFMLSFRYSFN